MAQDMPRSSWSSRRALIDRSTVAQFGLKRLKLREGASTFRAINKPNLLRLHFGMKRFKQIRPADSIDQHRPTIDRPPFGIHAIAGARDMKTDHPRAECLVEHLAITCIIAEIGNDQSIAAITAINLCKRTGAGMSIKSLRQFEEFAYSQKARRKRTIATDHSGRTITATPDIVGDDRRPETRPGRYIRPIERLGGHLRIAPVRIAPLRIAALRITRLGSWDMS